MPILTYNFDELPLKTFDSQDDGIYGFAIFAYGIAIIEYTNAADWVIVEVEIEIFRHASVPTKKGHALLDLTDPLSQIIIDALETCQHDNITAAICAAIDEANLDDDLND